MKWMIPFSVLICVILACFCITPVSAGSRSDLVFDLGGGVTDQWQKGLVASYYTKPAGKTYSGMNVIVEEYGSNAEYMYDYTRLTDRFEYSSCSLGDACSIGKGKGDFEKHHEVSFLSGNYVVRVYSQILDNAMSPTDLMATAQKIADVLSGSSEKPSDDKPFDKAWDAYFAAEFAEISRLESFIEEKKKELEIAKTQPSYNVDDQPIYPDNEYGEISLPSSQNIGQIYDVTTINAEITKAQNTIDRKNSKTKSYSREEVLKYYTLSGDERTKIFEENQKLINSYEKEVKDQYAIVEEGEEELTAATLSGVGYDIDDTDFSARKNVHQSSGMRGLGEDADDPSSTTIMKVHDAGIKIDKAREKIEKYEEKIRNSQAILNNLELSEKLLSTMNT